jgi:hypothetical protein
MERIDGYRVWGAANRMDDTRYFQSLMSAVSYSAYLVGRAFFAQQLRLSLREVEYASIFTHRRRIAHNSPLYGQPGTSTQRPPRPELDSLVATVIRWRRVIQRFDLRVRHVRGTTLAEMEGPL